MPASFLLSLFLTLYMQVCSTVKGQIDGSLVNVYFSGSVGSTRWMLTFTLFFLVYYQRGFVEAHADDGLLEIFGLKQGWHASFVMVELISAKHIAQVQYQTRNSCCLCYCVKF